MPATRTALSATTTALLAVTMAILTTTLTKEAILPDGGPGGLLAA
jgi:hypothetical protein